MTLPVGARLGPYEILSPLGAGGMGEVYRARDTKLGRDVALKVLPEAFTHDRERIARFQREAHTLASLNHPNIAHIYGLEEADGATALVMELVEGEDLSQRIVHGAIPLDEAMPIAKQIAEALEAAHEQGIIHRDLKPANIKVRSDGTVKVLDFGLAKAIDTAGQAGGAGQAGRVGRGIPVGQPASPALPALTSPTLTFPAQMTGVGVILGTAAYMSPEQARGRVVDKRADIWAFGCVLYEMLAGQRAFKEEDVSDTLAAVLRGEPDWTALPPVTPAAIRRLVQQCLVKDRHQRVADLAVARFVLTDPSTPVTRPQAPTSAGAPGGRSRVRSALVTVATVLATAVVAFAGAWSLRPSSLPPVVTRFSFALPESQQVVAARDVVAISPDGQRLAYAADNRIFVRSLSEFDAQAVRGTESPAVVSNPVFSPDGGSLAFFTSADNAVKRIAVSGGAAVTVCSASTPYGMTWDATAGILVGQNVNGILACSPNGAPPKTLATVDEGEQAHGPQMLPGGKALLFTIATAADASARWDQARVVVQTLTSGARTVVALGSGARYLPTGHLLYARGGIVFAVPFDPVSDAVRGEAVPVVEGVRRAGLTGVGTIHLDVSSTGTLFYMPGPTATPQRALAIANRTGVLTRLVIPPGPYVQVRASHDGGRLAIGSDDGKEAIVWIGDLDGTSPVRRLTFGGQNRFPLWSPDGQRVAFQSDREGDWAIFWQRADGTGPVERLTKPERGERHAPESWSPDGTLLSFSVEKGAPFGSTGRKEATNSLWTLTVATGQSAPFGAVESVEKIGSVFSPDGRWIAYASTPVAYPAPSSDRGIFVQPVPATGARYQVPKQQLDFHPVWGPGGTELFYVPTAASEQLSVVSVTMPPGVTFGRPVALPAGFTGNKISEETRAFDVLPDGKFVGVVPVSDPESVGGASAGTQLRVVLNWQEELKRLVPTR